MKKSKKQNKGWFKKGNISSRTYDYIIVKCRICGQLFKMPLSRIKNNRGKYCSRKCYLKDIKNIHKKTGIWGHCKMCGKDIYIIKSEIGKDKFCSADCRSKWVGEKRKGTKILSTSGKNHWNWKGGITPERTRIYFSKDYKDWVKIVYKRDNYTCQKCGDNTGNNLIPHHIESFADYPELRFDMRNGITLCKNCHTYFHSKYGTHHNNRKQLNKFLNENQETIITSRGRQVLAPSCF